MGVKKFLRKVEKGENICGKILINTFEPYIKNKYYKKYYSGKIKNIELEDATQNVYVYLWRSIPNFQGDNLKCFYKFCYRTIDNSFRHMITKTLRKYKNGITVFSINDEIYEGVERINTIEDKTNNDHYAEILLRQTIENYLAGKLPPRLRNYLLELLTNEDFCIKEFAVKNNITYETARKLKYRLRKKLVFVEGEWKIRVDG